MDSVRRGQKVTALPQKIQTILDHGQGPAARALDKLPTFVQESLAKILGYPHQYPDLDAFTKCLMAVQIKQGRIGFIGDDPIESRRQFDAQMLAILNKSTFIESVEDIRLPLQSGTVFARHYHPASNKKLPMIVFYHGGGFVVGGLDTHDEACRLIAKYAKVQVMSIDYPLAPEVSPKLLIQSCEDALAWVYQNRRQLKIYKNRIAVAGDSAGGNISTVVAQHSVGKAYAPQAQLLIYPVVDLKSRHPSFYAYGEGLVLTSKDVDYVTVYYATQHNVALDNPLISPTYGGLRKLAPAYVITAGHDLLHDEGEIYSHKLRQNGVKVKYIDYPDQTHGFINLTPISSKARRNTVEIARNFRKFWDKHS
ncbi:alpha/beta hydrolase fold domain-containing protein [Acinetobacter haemolyticus]|nr:esterase [Acinetobacter haemolyticus]NAR97350.1 alpha/beta hydrolase fold domain-containing protein [Acinetobacter haemolyticus]NAS06853.1 alpha/beta hydrolase fold domain-containing protein [Acinetobacter haemolyticus]NAS08317.1 alpha/beta hydrolase fold domain-containing protein [Acinetobacter haemolyticus]